jgi:phenylacetic acid degradation operon negative regulatory protein
MNKRRNIAAGSVTLTSPDTPGAGDATRIAGLGIEPLSARSVILSALLGTHPPELPARALVALAERFGIRAGTTRTSLSRMVANGELSGADGWYRLAGRLLERQREQDSGRVRNDQVWDGSWITVIAVNDRRSMTDRRAFRRSMEGARMAELRPDIWLRPANLEGPPASSEVIVTCGRLEVADPRALVDRLWPIDELESRAVQLRDALERQRPMLDDDETPESGFGGLPRSFMIAAAVVRFLRIEPQLPEELAPRPWTPPTLRPLYDEFDAAFQRQLRAFFASVE